MNAHIGNPCSPFSSSFSAYLVVFYFGWLSGDLLPVARRHLSFLLNRVSSLSVQPSLNSLDACSHREILDRAVVLTVVFLREKRSSLLEPVPGTNMHDSICAVRIPHLASMDER